MPDQGVFYGYVRYIKVGKAMLNLQVTISARSVQTVNSPWSVLIFSRRQFF